ncbi:MAG: DUF2971 domain-containing protein [Armatimonadetes bacterium]|nr:DUF2971 domain-containing protein [Armatimonadota bacterium]
MLPRFLYKYQSLDDHAHCLENLQRRQLFFQHPGEFDDPYDCAIQVVRAPTDADIEQLLDLYKDRLVGSSPHCTEAWIARTPKEESKKQVVATVRSVYDKQIDKVLNRWGVSCFSAIADSLLMWSHYAGGHTGICLEFDTRFAPFSHAHQVTYSDMPSHSVVDIIGGKTGALEPMILTKASCWSYQREWRLFVSDGGRTKQYDHRALTGLFFGARSTVAQQDEVLKALGDTPTQLRIMEKNPQSFMLSPTEYVTWRAREMTPDASNQTASAHPVNGLVLGPVS